jgi:hypothetical protein
MKSLASFAEAARAYIEWAESSKPASPAEDAREVLGLLVGLYAGAINLPEGQGAEGERAGTSQEEWSRIYTRCGNLPFDIYWEIFDPLTSEAEEPVGASLGDDLADIHRDLKLGMSYYAEGNEPAAAWEWQFNFRAHWGHHASAAIYALHAWWAAEYFAEPGV